MTLLLGYLVMVEVAFVTLGTLALYRSFLVEWSDAKTITTASLPQWLVDLPSANAFSIAGQVFSGIKPRQPR